MPRPPILRIAEIFPSFQGEGLRLGESTIFVRLAGCNLRCAFCDTKYAWEGGAEATAADVAERVGVIRRLWPAGWVAITGGEPCAQEIGGLIRRLRSAGLRVQIETNGTIYRPWPVDRLTISPKPPAWAYDARFRGRADEIKLVVTRALTPAVVARLRREFPARAPLILQPQSNAAWSRTRALRLAEEAIAEGLGDVRPGIQLHKVYGLP